MTRVTSGMATKKRHKRILNRAEGYCGSRSTLIRQATQAVDKAAAYATRDRKQRKRVFRSLWITRVSAAVQQLGMNYSRFVNSLATAKVALNRKMLSEIALRDPAGFQAIVSTVKK